MSKTFDDTVKVLPRNERSAVQSFVRIRDALLTGPAWENEPEAADRLAASLAMIAVLKDIEDAIIQGLPLAGMGN